LVGFVPLREQMHTPSHAADHRGARRDPARAALLALVALTLVGAALRIANAVQDLFADELATYWIVSAHDLAGVVRTVATDAEITPPLSFILSWLTSRGGLSPFLVRLPAVVAGIATIPLVYRLGRRTVGRPAGLLAAALTTFSPFMILYSAEARGYGLLMALLVVSTLALLAALESGSRGWWATYVICVCLAMYTHYTAAFVLGVQLAWALWRHPARRVRLVVTTGVAGLLYLPWLLSLRADLDSPTTQILSSFSPLSADMVRETLGHWSVGFPYAFRTTALLDLPGLAALLMLAASIGMGLFGRFTSSHGSIGEGDRRPVDGGPLLVMLLALATPLGTFVQSVASTNVFSVRSLAASWPYLALAASAVILWSPRSVRALAAGLAVTSFVVGGLMMLGPNYRRPDFVAVARFADEHGAAVVINAAATPPGPLTQLDVEESTPTAPVLRLSVPEQTDRPFAIGDPVPDPVDVFRRAATTAEGGPILVVSLKHDDEKMARLIDTLPEGYEVTDERVFEGLFVYDLRATLLERDAGG